MEKLFNQTLYLLITILKQKGHIAHITFNFDHIVQREMSDNSQSGLPHSGILLMKILVEVSVVRLNYVWKTVQEITHSNNDVVFSSGGHNRTVEQSDYMRKLLLAER